MQAIMEFCAAIVTLFLMHFDVTGPLLIAIPLLPIILSIVAVVRHVKERRRPSLAAIIPLLLGMIHLLLVALLLLLAHVDLSPYLFGEGIDTLLPICIGLTVLYLSVGMIALMIGVFRKYIVVILAIILALWSLVFSSLLITMGFTSEYERADHDTVIETENILGHTTITEYEIIFPGLMKEVEVTYEDN